MDEKVKDSIKELYDKLTDEQKVKVETCKSQAELVAFLSEEDIAIPDELLSGVAGGFVWHP